MDADITLLHEKLDRISAQLETQRKRQEMADELWRDLAPVLNDVFRCSIEELDDVGSDFALEDVLHLGKRLLRDTRLLTSFLDRLQALMELSDEMGRLGQPVFMKAILALDEMERKGYFTFIEGTQYIVDRIVTEFGEDDIKALGDNIVTILTTVRNMTQPDVMRLANNLVDSVRQDEIGSEKVSTWALFKEFNDPAVRRGLMRMLHAVKAIDPQPDATPN